MATCCRWSRPRDMTSSRVSAIQVSGGEILTCQKYSSHLMNVDLRPQSPKPETNYNPNAGTLASLSVYTTVPAVGAHAMKSEKKADTPDIGCPPLYYNSPY